MFSAFCHAGKGSGDGGEHACVCVYVVHMCSHLFNVFMAFSGSAQNIKKIISQLAVLLVVGLKCLDCAASDCSM